MPAREMMSLTISVRAHEIAVVKEFVLAETPSSTQHLKALAILISRVTMPSLVSCGCAESRQSDL